MQISIDRGISARLLDRPVRPLASRGVMVPDKSIAEWIDLGGEEKKLRGPGRLPRLIFPWARKESDKLINGEGSVGRVPSSALNVEDEPVAKVDVGDL